MHGLPCKDVLQFAARACILGVKLRLVGSMLAPQAALSGIDMGLTRGSLMFNVDRLTGKLRSRIWLWFTVNCFMNGQKRAFFEVSINYQSLGSPTRLSL